MQLRTGPANRRKAIHELKNQPSQIAISLYQLGTGKFLRVCERVRLNVEALPGSLPSHDQPQLRKLGFVALLTGAPMST